MALSSHAIFDPVRQRTDGSPCGHEESMFAFYDRCANGVIGLVRPGATARTCLGGSATRTGASGARQFGNSTSTSHC